MTPRDEAITAIVAALATATPLATAAGTFTQYDDRASWVAAVGEFSTIAFTEYPVGTHIDSQFAHLGIFFVDKWNFIHTTSSFLNDGHGLTNNVHPEEIIVTFERPQHWIGADYPGGLWMDIYAGEKLIGSTRFAGAGGAGFFGGIHSVRPFDRAVLWDVNSVSIDDLHFGPPPCLADVNLDGIVDVDDLVEVILAWDCASPPECGESDVNRDGAVNVDDVVAVIIGWGLCPQ